MNGTSTQSWPRFACSSSMAPAPWSCLGLRIFLLVLVPLLAQVSGFAQISVRLAWDANTETNLAGYRLYYGVRGGSVTNIVENKKDVIRQLNDLQPAAAYFFYVTAYSDKQFESEPSNVVLWTAPTVGGGHGFEGGSALWWIPSTESASYVVKRSEQRDDGFQTLATNSAPFWEDSSAQRGRTYFYRIAVVTSAGESRDSDPVEIVPAAGPASLSAKGGADRIRLSWESMPGAQDYSIVRSLAVGGPYTSLVSGIRGAEFEDLDVEIGKQYFYRVRGRFVVGGFSGYSVSASSQTVPAAPSQVSAELYSSGTIRLSWFAAEKAVDGFILESSTNGIDFVEAARLEGLIRTQLLTGFANGSRHFFRVVALNSAGRSPASPVATIEFPVWSAHVRFAPESEAGLIPGYIIDAGKAFGDRGGGTRYGWKTDRSGLAGMSSSAIAPDRRFESSIPVDDSEVWELELPRGSYRVRLVAGNAGQPAGAHQFLLEELSTNEGFTSPNTPWVEFTKRLFVEDGRLTIRATELASDSRLYFIDVVAEAPVRPVFDEFPRSQEVVEEDAVQLSASISDGTEPITWQWFWNSRPVPGANRATLDLPAIQPSQGGSYFVVASNVFGAVTSRVAVVSVEAEDDPPTLDVIPSLLLVSGAPLHTLILSGISQGAPDENQRVSLSLSNGNPALLRILELDHRPLEPTALLKLNAASGATGAVVVGVTVSDGASQLTRSFTVTWARRSEDALQVEAESGQFSGGFVVTNETGAFGGRIIRPNGDGSGRVAFPVRLESEGDYFVWCRFASEEVAGIALRAAWDREPTDTEEYGLPAGRPNAWRWARLSRFSNGDPKAFALTRNIHSLVFTTPRARVKLDSIHLTDDPQYLPQGLQPNLPPTLDPLADLVLEEGSGPQVVSLSGIGTGSVSERQNLVVTAVSSDSRIVPNPNVSYSSPASSGTLTVNPIRTAFGTVSISVTVNDSGALNPIARRMFSVTIIPQNQPPKLPAIANQSVPKGRPFPAIPWTIGDRETPPEQLILRAFSSNPLLIPDHLISVVGAGSNRVVQVTSIPNAIGTAQISLEVTDAAGSASTATFNATVTDGRTPPSISTIPDLVIDEDTSTGPLTFVVGDVETPPSELVVSATSSDVRLVPAAGVVLEGEGADRTLTLIPGKDAFGTCTVTLTVRDGSGSLSTSVFQLVVRPRNDPPTLATIADRTVTLLAASNTVFLSGITAGPGETQPLTLRAFSERPDLIPHPVVLFSNPELRTASLVLGPFQRVADKVPIRVILEDGEAVRGVLTQVFHVTVAAPSTDVPPIISAIPDQRMDEDSILRVPFTIGDELVLPHALVLTVSSSQFSLFPENLISFSGVGTNRTMVLKPTLHQSGSATLTVNVSDGRFISRTSFKVTVTPVNDPPTLDAIHDLAVVASSSSVTHSVPLSGITSGPPNESGALSVLASSSRTDLLPHPEVRYAPGTQFGELLLKPVAGRSGTAVVLVTIGETADPAVTTQRQFRVHIRASDNKDPEISFLDDLTMAQNGVGGPISFRVIDSTSTPESLIISATSSNLELLQDTGIVFGGTGTNRTLVIRPEKDRTGFSMVTLNVSDGHGGFGTSSFFVIVDPVNQAPVIEGLMDQVLPIQDPHLELEFVAMDLETPPGKLELAARSSDESLIPKESIQIRSAGKDRLLILDVARGRAGKATITVSANDGLVVSERAFEVSVVSSNEPPVILPIPDLVLSEGGVAEDVTVSVMDSETPFANLQASAESSNTNLVPNANLILSRTLGRFSLRIAPAKNQVGRTLIVVRASDGVHEVQQVFEVEVEAVNDHPTIDPVSTIVVPQDGSPRTVMLTGISPGLGEEGQPLLLTASSADPTLLPHPVPGTLQSNGTAILNLMPVTGGLGNTTVRVTVSDLQRSNSVTFREFAVRFNAAPNVSAIDAITIMEDGESDILAFRIGDEDDDPSTLSVSVRSTNEALIGSSGVEFSGRGQDRTLRVRPAAGGFGTALLTVLVRDSAGNEANSPFVVVVLPSDDPPTLGFIPDLEIASTAKWVPVQIGGISLGSDREKGVLEVSAVSSSPNFLPDPVVEYRSPNDTAVLYLAPLPGLEGTAEMKVTVLEVAGTPGVPASRVTRTFRVTRLKPEPIPELLIEASEAGIVLSWTADRTSGYALQSTEDLGGGEGWKKVSAVPAIQAGRYRAVLPLESGVRLFRLCRGCAP